MNQPIFSIFHNSYHFLAIDTIIIYGISLNNVLLWNTIGPFLKSNEWYSQILRLSLLVSQKQFWYSFRLSINNILNPWSSFAGINWETGINAGFQLFWKPNFYHPMGEDFLSFKFWEIFVKCGFIGIYIGLNSTDSGIWFFIVFTSRISQVISHPYYFFA